MQAARGRGSPASDISNKEIEGEHTSTFKTGWHSFPRGEKLLLTNPRYWCPGLIFLPAIYEVQGICEHLQDMCVKASLLEYMVGCHVFWSFSQAAHRQSRLEIQNIVEIVLAVRMECSWRTAMIAIKYQLCKVLVLLRACSLLAELCIDPKWKCALCCGMKPFRIVSWHVTPSEALKQLLWDRSQSLSCEQKWQLWRLAGMHLKIIMDPEDCTLQGIRKWLAKHEPGVLSDLKSAKAQKAE